jgi:hypothetical protein
MDVYANPVGVVISIPARAMAFRAPLLGYNTNVRHKGKLFHIQTEDSGINHPHIITHLFADGGRILASKKTSYAEHVGSDNLQDTVKKLMQAQHKAMFIALRDGVYDEDGPNDAARDQTTGTIEKADPKADAKAAVALASKGNSAPPAAAAAPAPERAPLYQGTRAASKISERPAAPDPRAPRSIFGGDLLSEKSLDEVILSYLASDEDGR